MKSKTALIGLGLFSLLSASSAVIAEDYQTEVEAKYIDADGFDGIGLTGTYYFNKVKTEKTAWAEAEFTKRATNVSASFFDFDGDIDTAGILGRFYGGNNVYGAVGITDVDGPAGGDTVISGEIGYFLDKYWLVSLATTSSDGTDPVFLKTKYFRSLGDDQFVNFEASLDDEETDLTVAGDYYWTATTGFGVELTQSDLYDFGVRFQHFFTPAVAIKAGVRSGDVDSTHISLVARF